MPVTTRIITAERASSLSARSSEKSPAVIHVKSVWLICRFSGGMAASAITCITEIPNESTITAVARPPEIDFGRRFPRKALTRKPPNGSSGISASTGSPLEARKGFGVERLAMAEQGDHERQADRRLGGGDGHDEEGDDLPVDLAELAAERDERQVDGVQHDLDRHQQRDDVAAQEHARRADGEQQAREHQVMANGHRYSSLLRASTTAPTIAAMIRMDVTSNANMYLVKSTRPSSA